MTEDKLTHDERLRLECMAQAVNIIGVRRSTGASVDEFITTAMAVERFIRQEEPHDADAR